MCVCACGFVCVFVCVWALGSVGGVGRLGGVGPWARDPHLYESPLGQILTFMGPPWVPDPHLYGIWIGIGWDWMGLDGIG